MTRDEIAVLMNEACGMHWGDEAHFQRFAALVAAAEREACAKVCESLWPEMHKYWGPGQARAACDDCADAIRARRNHE